MMPDYTEFFEQALAEHGVDARVVMDEDPTSDIFYVMKPIGDEKLTYKQQLNTRINVTEDEVRTRIAQQARHIASEFEEYLTDTYTWTDDARRVQVSAMEQGWAECQDCGTRVEVPEPTMSLWTEDAEMTTPQPMPFNGERDITNLDEGSRLLLKMYLIGRLRERCETWCHNSKFNDFNRNDMHIYRPASD